MKNEYFEFLKSQEKDIPTPFSKSLCSRIKKDLQPVSRISTVLKFFLIQFSVGILTLTICPQFGIGPWGGGHGISYYFMQIGTWACASFCGFFYFGLSYFLGFVILEKREVRFFSKNRALFIPLVISAFMILMMAGKHSGVGHSMFFENEFLTIWLLVGLISSQIALETSKFFKLNNI